MDARLNGIILGRQAKGVKTHRVEDGVALHAFYPRPRIGETKIPPMPHMEFSSGRVRKHLQAVKLVIDIFAAKFVDAVLLPAFLPFNVGVLAVLQCPHPFL